MDSLQIKKLMEWTPYSKQHFGGVYALDQICDIIVNKRHLPQCFVFNYDPSYKPGSHWVAAIYTSPGQSHLFFDSYGRPPAFKTIHKFLENRYKYNSVQYQNELTSTCGEWCIFFLWYHLTHQQVNWNFVFDTNFTLQNDEMVNEWINQTFGPQHVQVINKALWRQQIASSQRKNKQKYPYRRAQAIGLRSAARKTLDSLKKHGYSNYHRARREPKNVRFKSS